MADQQQVWETIKEKPYCDPMRRMDFVLLFDVKDGNPNGDPDAGNLPRMDPMNRHGIVTDVCIKRKIRDYLANVLNRPIFIQSQEALNTLYFRAANTVDSAKDLIVELPIPESKLKEMFTEEKVGKKHEPSEQDLQTFGDWLGNIEVEGLEHDPESEMLTYFGEAKNKKDFNDLLTGEQELHDPLKKYVPKLAQAFADAKKQKGGKLSRAVRETIKGKMCQLYDDIRCFGAVLTAGTNAGQIRGPLQLTFARSVEPILQQDAAITRCAITKESDRARKQTEFGRKSWLNYAAYRQHGFFNPLLAQQTELTRDDLARFWEALACMFPNSASASKGEMATRDLIVFVHSNSRGNAPSHKLFDRIKFSKSETNGELLTIEDEDKIKAHGVTIHRPLNEDMWPGL